MAEVGDIIRIKMITEMQGVAMTNLLYFQIDDLGDDGTILDQLNDFAVQFFDSIKPVQSNLWQLTCVIYRNESRIEEQVVSFVNFVGEHASSGHPTHQVVRFNKYANTVDETKTKVGAFNLTGFNENSSSRGRIQNTPDYSFLLGFLRGPLVLATTGWQVSPQLRWTLDPGPPKVFTWTNIIKIRLSHRMNILASRKSVLCATG